jgi:hypothetical protein
MVAILCRIIVYISKQNFKLTEELIFSTLDFMREEFIFSMRLALPFVDDYSILRILSKELYMNVLMRGNSGVTVIGCFYFKEFYYKI